MWRGRAFYVTRPTITEDTVDPRPTHVRMDEPAGPLERGFEIDAVARVVRILTFVDATVTPERADALRQWAFRRNAVAMARAYGTVVDEVGAARAAAGDMDGVTGRGERVVHVVVRAMRILHAAALDDEPMPPEAVVEAFDALRSFEGRPADDTTRAALQSVAERVSEIVNELSDPSGPTAGMAASEALADIPELADTGMGAMIVDTVDPILLGLAFGSRTPLPAVADVPSDADAPGALARAAAAASAIERADAEMTVATRTVSRAMADTFMIEALAEVIVGRPVFVWRTVVEAGIVGGDSARLFVNSALAAGVVRSLDPKRKSGRVFAFPAAVSLGMADVVPAQVIGLTGRGLDGDRTD